ncbi:MAG: 2-hydroxychromene-2-carboxylate isomerase [Burkholderiales bacterium]|nr:MAG: 2-hydroxychromene-2-carboxylate isomerase [Burkholderiales bacterium]
MSLKGLLSPPISAWLLSRERLMRRRARAERARRARGGPHRIHYFHQPDDPYSVLAACLLPELARCFAVEIVPHVVGAPDADAAPERERLVAWSRRDAALLARRHGLDFADPGRQPPAAALGEATARLVAAIEAGTFVATAADLTRTAWAAAGSPQDAPGARDDDIDAPRRRGEAPDVAAHLAASAALRRRLGHYLGATFHLDGEWYWGLDRLPHLERRLQDLGVARPGQGGLPLVPDVDREGTLIARHPGPIEFWFSLRSPYSAIAAPRIVQLAKRAGVPLRLRGLLPMVMRGLPVPRIKRAYIAADAAREAHVRGIPFGRLVDPVGRPVERGLAVMHHAERAGLGEAFLLSFMRGTWAEGIDAGSDRGLRTIAERAGLAWSDCRDALEDDDWRPEAERNRVALFERGLWGVPAFAVGATAVWGQDRIWAVADALEAGAPPAERP